MRRSDPRFYRILRFSGLVSKGGCVKCEYTHWGSHTYAEWLFVFQGHHWLRHGGKLPIMGT